MTSGGLCLIDGTLCDGKTGEPILSVCHGSKIMEPYALSMTGICMHVSVDEVGEAKTCGVIKLGPSLEAHTSHSGGWARQERTKGVFYDVS